MALVPLLSLLWLAPVLAQQSPAPVLTVGGQAFASWPEYTGSEAFQSQGWRCGTTPLAPALELRAPSDCTFDATVIRPEHDPQANPLLRVPVVVHVLMSSNGRGALSDATVLDQIAVLNEDFRAQVGTLGALGTDTRIEFFLADRDPQGNPSTGITRTVNDDWFADRGAYYDVLAWDPARYLNAYTNEASGALGYVPGLPQSGGAGTSRDRVVVLWAAFGRGAPIGPPYDLGRTLTHEVGHYLGLFHTFDFGCGSADCYASGDRICDTNPEASPVFGCPAASLSCGSSDPIHNYMDYTDDACYEHFTPEQANRMRCTLAGWRADLALPCLTATVAVRSGGQNENVLAATPPVLGGAALVTLNAPGRTSAVLFGYARPAALPLARGRVLLVDETSPRYFLLAIPPTGSVTLSVPSLTSLCGRTAYAQAALFGGPTWALTNSVDLTPGP